MAIRYPKEVHEFIQANYYGRRPEELAVLVNKKFSSGYTPAQMKSYVKKENCRMIFRENRYIQMCFRKKL